MRWEKGRGVRGSDGTEIGGSERKERQIMNVSAV